jgi:predicted MPP superfamily phosphohydrolase
MNKLWAITFFALPLIGIGYTFWRIWFLLPLSSMYKAIVLLVLLLCILLLFVNFGLLNIDRWPMWAATATYEVGTSSLFILLYVVILFLLLDLGRLVHVVPRSWLFDSWKGTIAITVVLMSVFTYGYFHYMNKVRMPLDLPTTKTLLQPKTIVMMSDLHIGYHNQRKELARWIDLVNAEKPDLILIGGDIIDGRMRPIIDQDMAAEFSRLQAPVYACLGNHEYYGGEQEAEKFYRAAHIHLLRDEVATVWDINIIGRDDRTNPHRKSVAQLMQGVDKSKYTILLDHQPYHLEEAERNGIDFQLSGHTHYGQVWPISWIEDAMYEDAYGQLRKGNTQYYVTSGIGIWGGKFRIGTQSEYIVARLSPANALEPTDRGGRN